MLRLLSRVLPAALFVCLPMGGLAQAVAEYNPATGDLVIPEVKVGTVTVYSATLRHEGNSNFKLLSYQTTPPGSTPAPTPTPTPVPLPSLGDPTALQQWLTDGNYKSWACEAASHGPTLGSPHGTVRICSNSLLSTATSGSYPVGAATVKELFSGGAINGYALGVKVAAGEGANTWHWYERIGSSLVVNSVGAGICEGCHRNASRDRIFVRVTQ